MNKIIVSAWAGFVVYAIVIYLAGPAGLGAMGELERQRDRMEANLEDLMRINAALAEQFAALGTVPGRMALEARDLAYLSPGEVLVRLEGVPGGTRKARLAGSVLRLGTVPHRNAAIPALAGMAAGLFVLVLLGLGATERAKPRLRLSRDDTSGETLPQ
jgi:hypothetical protein